jgi:hypothetical protein
MRFFMQSKHLPHQKITASHLADRPSLIKQESQKQEAFSCQRVEHEDQSNAIYFYAVGNALNLEKTEHAWRSE